MHTIREVEQHFDDGADSVTLTRAEWRSIEDTFRAYSKNDSDVYHARKEVERVKRMATPLWRACKHVARGIRNAAGSPSLWHLREWEMTLRHAAEVDWNDLPQHLKQCFPRAIQGLLRMPA